MATITWNTEVNAPCCPGEILSHDERRSILIQRDTDFPSVAQTFGWSLASVQKRGKHKCAHDGSDGSIDCRECGVTALQFINAARDWLEANDGATAEDPGYFND